MKNLIFLFFALIVFAGCEKKDTGPELPPITHNGANTFGCKIDGEVFVAGGKPNSWGQYGVTAHPFVNFAWSISGQTGTKTVELNFDNNANPHVPGTFEMAGNYPERGYYFYYPDGTVPTGSTEYETDSVHKGTVTVTNFTTTYASGTFAFDAMNGDGKVVHITEGRFDIAF